MCLAREPTGSRPYPLSPEVINVTTRIVVLLLLCSCLPVSTAHAQGMLMPPTQNAPAQVTADPQTQNARLESMLSYENEKKDVGVAVLLGLLLPGAGDLYAGSTGTGLLLLGAAVTGVVIASNGDPYTGQAVLLASLLTSPISAGMSASDHNSKLKKRLGLAVNPSLQSPAVAVVCSF